jgi:hypothetical protein
MQLSQLRRKEIQVFSQVRLQSRRELQAPHRRSPLPGIALLATLMFLPTLVAAETGAETAAENGAENDVMAHLQGYEWQIPSSPLPVRDADRILIEVASDESRPNFIRARAAAALTLYPTERVFDYYENQVRTAASVVRRRSVDAMCVTFLPGKSARVESLVSPLLTSSDPHLRARSAHCLRNIESDSARQALSVYRNSVAEWEATAAGFDR